MAIFRLSACDGSVELIVRARCFASAREAAANRSPVAERAMWRSSALSSVELIWNPEGVGYLSNGKIGLIHRKVKP